jgi:hypothetical protein
MSQRIIPDEAKTLRKAQDLIRDEEDWCQEEYREISGFLFMKEVRYCAIGALMQVTGCFKKYRSEYSVLRKHLTDSAYMLYEMGPETVNDRCGHAAVMKVYDHAINRLIEGANK